VHAEFTTLVAAYPREFSSQRQDMVNRMVFVEREERGHEDEADGRRVFASRVQHGMGANDAAIAATTAAK
jgi:hypothetical protein